MTLLCMRSSGRRPVRRWLDVQASHHLSPCGRWIKLQAPRAALVVCWHCGCVRGYLESNCCCERPKALFAVTCSAEGGCCSDTCADAMAHGVCMSGMRLSASFPFRSVFAMIHLTRQLRLKPATIHIRHTLATPFARDHAETRSAGGRGHAQPFASVCNAWQLHVIAIVIAIVIPSMVIRPYQLCPA